MLMFDEAERLFIMFGSLMAATEPDEPRRMCFFPSEAKTSAPESVMGLVLLLTFWFIAVLWSGHEK